MRFLGKFNCIKEGRRGIAFSNRYILLDGLVCGVGEVGKQEILQKMFGKF